MTWQIPSPYSCYQRWQWCYGPEILHLLCPEWCGMIRLLYHIYSEDKCWLPLGAPQNNCVAEDISIYPSTCIDITYPTILRLYSWCFPATNSITGKLKTYLHILSFIVMLYIIISSRRRLLSGKLYASTCCVTRWCLWCTDVQSHYYFIIPFMMQAADCLHLITVTLVLSCIYIIYPSMFGH